MILVNKPAGAGLSAESGNIGSSPDSAAAGLVILAIYFPAPWFLTQPS